MNNQETRFLPGDLNINNVFNVTIQIVLCDSKSTLIRLKLVNNNFEITILQEEDYYCADNIRNLYLKEKNLSAFNKFNNYHIS